MALTLHGITFIAMNRCAVEKLNMFTKLSTHIRIYLLILRRYLNRYFAFLLLKNVPWSIKWTLGTYLVISIDKWTQSVIPKKERLYILLIFTRNQFFCQFHSLCIMILARVIDYYCYFHVIYVLIQDLFLTSSHYIMTNGIFLNIEDYISSPQYQ